MNKMVKVSLAGLAAAAMIAPASVAFAQKTGPNFYGMVNYQLTMTDEVVGLDADETVWRSNSDASRFGVRGNFALDNGLTAIYQIETGFNYDGGNLASRDTFVGLQGDFGTFTVGRQSHSYRQFVGLTNYSAATQEPWGLGGRVLEYDDDDDVLTDRGMSRQNDTIKYSGKAGDINFGVSLLPVIGGETGDMSFAVGGSMEVAPGITVGLGMLSLFENAYDFEKFDGTMNDETVIGFKVEYKDGPLMVGFGYEMWDEWDFDQIVLPVKYDLGNGLSVNATLHQFMPGCSDCDDVTSFMIGADKSLGGGTTIYFKYQLEGDALEYATKEDDKTTIAFGIQHAF